MGLQNQIRGLLLWLGGYCPTRSVTTLKPVGLMHDLHGRLAEPLALGLGRLRETLAASIHAEVGNPERFQTAEELVSYCGLDPKAEQSGETSREGERERKGNKSLRWALVEGPQHFAKSSRSDELSLEKFYQHLAFREPLNRAKVGLARRLAHVIFATLRDQTDFDPERLAA